MYRGAVVKRLRVFKISNDGLDFLCILSIWNIPFVFKNGRMHLKYGQWKNIIKYENISKDQVEHLYRYIYTNKNKIKITQWKH